MSLWAKKLLLASETKYTLTVVTSPANATCVLTVDGIQYTTKSLKVKKGTVVNYSVSYSGTTTKTGSVTMDSNKTLTFTRTYSTTTTNTFAANYTVTGSPTITSDYIVSGFSSSNYLTLPQNFPANTTSYEVVLKFKTSSPSTAGNMCGCTSTSNALYVPQVRISSSKIEFLSPSNTSVSGTTTIQADTWYTYKCKWNGSTKYVQKWNGSSWITENTKNTTKALTGGAMRLGNGSANSYNNYSFTNGTLDLKECYINVNGQRWWDIKSTTISYTYYFSLTTTNT